MVNKLLINKIYGEWLDYNLSSNVYAVASLKQGLSIEHNGSNFLVLGFDDGYSAAYDQFIRRLSRRVYGTTTYRRTKKLLPNAVTLEGGPSKLKRYHLNIHLRRPEWLTVDKLRSLFLEEWAEIVWAMPDVYLKERTGKCVGYSLKEGPETLLLHSLRF